MSEVRDKNLEHILKEQEKLDRERRRVKKSWKSMTPEQRMRRIESLIRTYREVIGQIEENIENLKKTRERLVQAIAELKWCWYSEYNNSKKRFKN